MSSAKEPVVEIYTSAVSGNLKTRSNQSRLESLLAIKKIDYRIIDVSIDDEAKSYMKRKNLGATTELPQIFVKGEFKGLFDDFINALEGETLKVFLGINV